MFKKPSKCGSSGCVEVDMDWHTASPAGHSCVEVSFVHRSDCLEEGNCLEAAGIDISPGTYGVELPKGERLIALRDSKLGEDSPILVFTEDEWQAFQKGMANGEFDL